MKFCGKCGKKMEDGIKFCPACGEAQQEQFTQQNGYETRLQGLDHNREDATSQFDSKDIERNKAMAVLAYLGIFVLIPLFAAKDSKFARYHTNQGLVLLIAEIVYAVAYNILAGMILAISWRLYTIVSLLGFVGVIFFVLMIIGIINVVNGRAKELPVIGMFKLLK